MTHIHALDYLIQKKYAELEDSHPIMALALALIGFPVCLLSAVFVFTAAAAAPVLWIFG